MKLLSLTQLTLAAGLIGVAAPQLSYGQYAAQVVSYNAGTSPSTGFTTASAALGEPERYSGEGGPFPSVVSPFSPPFLSSEVVSIGEGGQITLRLSNFAVTQSSGPPEIGVFANVGIADIDYPNGQAGPTASTFSALDSAEVAVSADGISWSSLGSKLFDVPTNGYTDVGPFASVPGSALTDFQQPFVGTLSSFDGRSYSSMLTLLAGSGGGKWLDISGAGLTQVGYVRFSLADDGNSNTHLNFDLDAVSISHAAIGGATVPEPTGIALVIMALLPVTLACRGSRFHFRSGETSLGAMPKW
jgi:hypothetical protein